MAEIFDFGFQKYRLKLSGVYNQGGLFAVVGDTARRIEVQLLDAAGRVTDTTGIELSLSTAVGQSSSYVDANLIDASKGLYQVDLTNGLFLKPGKQDFQWKIYKDGKQLHSVVSRWHIYKNVSDGGNQSFNFYLNVDDLKRKMEELEDKQDEIKGMQADMEAENAAMISETESMQQEIRDIQQDFVDDTVESEALRISIEQSVEERYSNLEADYAQDLSKLKQNDAELTTQQDEQFDMLEFHRNLSKSKKYYFPEQFDELPNINVRKDASGNIVHDFNPEDYFELSGGSSYYVDPENGDDSNSGLSTQEAFETLQKALSTNDVEVIYLAAGMYSREVGLVGNFIDKSVKIKSLNGRAVLGAHMDVDWVNHENIRKSQPPYEPTRVLSGSRKFSELIKKDTTQEVIETKNTWCYVDGELYVNSDSSNIFPEPTTHLLRVRNSTMYLEGIDFLFGIYGIETENSTVLAKSCSIQYASSNGYINKDSNAYLLDCQMAYNGRRGINHQERLGTPSKFLEVGCSMFKNGLSNETSVNIAGSHSETNSLGMRIGGFYYENKGENISDLNSMTYNLNVVAHDSKAIDAHNTGFANNGGMQWIDNCQEFGNNYSTRVVGSGNTKILHSILENELGGLSDQYEFIEPSMIINELVGVERKYVAAEKLNITYHNSDGYYPLELSKDGETLWGDRNIYLVKSTDGWQSHQTVHTFPAPIGAIKEMDNGELIVATKNKSGERTGKIYVSSSNKQNWTEVLRASHTDNHFSQPFGGISTHGNIVVAGEYGTQGYARKVWLSKDYGQTFEEILDIGYAEGRHVHGVAYDKWYDRIWVVNGDGANKAIRFSDDFGASWHIVSNEYQPVGIIPTEKSVLFTMDGAPNGIMLWERTDKSDRNLELEIGYHLNPESDQTLYCGQTHFIGSDGVIYMPTITVENGRYSYIFATKDGINISEVYRTPEVMDSWRGIINIFENPATGGMIGLYNVHQDDGAYGIVKSSNIPSWTRV